MTMLDTTIPNTHSEVSTSTVANEQTLRDHVEVAVERYLSSLEGQEVENLYDLVLAEVEAPLLESVMRHTRGNQTKAAIMLGLNRGTLRKKLKIYGLN
jgi:Fis family transcriptional regulator, factor for inversion stimulation protein